MDKDAVKKRITAAIREIVDSDYGFDAFVMMKDEGSIKKLILDEGDPTKGRDNFKAQIGCQIKEAIETKFLAEDADYCLAEQLEDNQKKFYAIRHDENYEPFRIIDIPEEEMQSFSIGDKDAAQGFLFRFMVDGIKTLWAYQHLWPAAIPNKRKENRFFKKISPETDDVFDELKDTIFTITQKVDLLIVSSELSADEADAGENVTEIVTSNTSLMERTFGLETFIRSSARQVVSSINEVGLIADTDKLFDYLSRGNGNKKYARKMMRVKNSKVFELSADDLKEKLVKSDRWKGKFQFDDNGKITLDTYKNVEDLIDLFDERYTRSDITGQEYDTLVKNLAEKSSQETQG